MGKIRIRKLEDSGIWPESFCGILVAGHFLYRKSGYIVYEAVPAISLIRICEANFDKRRVLSAVNPIIGSRFCFL